MIKVEGLSKCFKLYNKPIDRLKEIFVKRKYYKRFLALEDVSFEVEAGETLGIIGENGAGKSTILKILAGITIPDKGIISINGLVTGLLELGTGFNSELTGLQNIYLNGTLLGMTRAEIDKKKQTITDFAELGPFINNSLKLYSSGMVMRLAFSVAIHAEPKCFIVDEALSVGDAYFQQKCMRKIQEFKQSGGSIVFVSHDMNAVKMLCDKAILLDKGKVTYHGIPAAVINQYNFQLAQKQKREQALQWDSNAQSTYGTFEVKTSNVSIFGINSQTHVMCSGEKAVVSMDLVSSIDLENLTVGFDIRDRFGQIVFGINTYHLGKELTVQKNGEYQLIISFPMNIGVGQYTLGCALHTGKTHEDHCFQWSDNIAKFEVSGILKENFIGLCRLEPEVQILDISK